eukprot:g2160.t1
MSNSTDADAELRTALDSGESSAQLAALAALPPAQLAAAVDMCRMRGNDAFRRKEYAAARACYTEALAGADVALQAAEKQGTQAMRSDAAAIMAKLLANRSASTTALVDLLMKAVDSKAGKGEARDTPSCGGKLHELTASAVQDADRAVALLPRWHKAHFRLGRALLALANAIGRDSLPASVSAGAAGSDPHITALRRAVGAFAAPVDVPSKERKEMARWAARAQKQLHAAERSATTAKTEGLSGLGANLRGQLGQLSDSTSHAESAQPASDLSGPGAPPTIELPENATEEQYQEALSSVMSSMSVGAGSASTDQSNANANAAAAKGKTAGTDSSASTGRLTFNRTFAIALAEHASSGHVLRLLQEQPIDSVVDAPESSPKDSPTARDDENCGIVVVTGTTSPFAPRILASVLASNGVTLQNGRAAAVQHTEKATGNGNDDSGCAREITTRGTAAIANVPLDHLSPQHLLPLGLTGSETELTVAIDLADVFDAASGFYGRRLLPGLRRLGSALDTLRPGCGTMGVRVVPSQLCLKAVLVQVREGALLDLADSGGTFDDAGSKSTVVDCDSVLRQYRWSPSPERVDMVFTDDPAALAERERTATPSPCALALTEVFTVCEHDLLQVIARSDSDNNGMCKNGLSNNSFQLVAKNSGRADAVLFCNVDQEAQMHFIVRAGETICDVSAHFSAAQSSVRFDVGISMKDTAVNLAGNVTGVGTSSDGGDDGTNRAEEYAHALPQWRRAACADMHRFRTTHRAVRSAIAQQQRETSPGLSHVLHVGCGASAGVIALSSAMLPTATVSACDGSAHLVDCIAREHNACTSTAASVGWMPCDSRRIRFEPKHDEAKHQEQERGQAQQPDAAGCTVTQSVDVVVFERLDEALVGEGILHLAAAMAPADQTSGDVASEGTPTPLLSPRASVVPSRARVYVVAVELHFECGLNDVDVHSAWSPYRFHSDPYPLELSRVQHRVLSRPLCVFGLDIEGMAKGRGLGPEAGCEAAVEEAKVAVVEAQRRATAAEAAAQQEGASDNVRRLAAEARSQARSLEQAVIDAERKLQERSILSGVNDALELHVTRPGRFNALVYWWEALMWRCEDADNDAEWGQATNDVVLSSAPDNAGGSTRAQMVQPMEELFVDTNDVLPLRARHDGTSITFGIRRASFAPKDARKSAGDSTMHGAEGVADPEAGAENVAYDAWRTGTAYFDPVWVRAMGAVQQQGQQIAQMLSASQEGVRQAAAAAAAIAIDPARFNQVVYGAKAPAGEKSEDKDQDLAQSRPQAQIMPLAIDHEKASQFCSQFFM